MSNPEQESDSNVRKSKRQRVPNSYYTTGLAAVSSGGVEGATTTNCANTRKNQQANRSNYRKAGNRGQQGGAINDDEEYSWYGGVGGDNPSNQPQSLPVESSQWMDCLMPDKKLLKLRVVFETMNGGDHVSNGPQQGLLNNNNGGGRTVEGKTQAGQLSNSGNIGNISGSLKGGCEPPSSSMVSRSSRQQAANKANNLVNQGNNSNPNDNQLNPSFNSSTSNPNTNSNPNPNGKKAEQPSSSLNLLSLFEQAIKNVSDEKAPASNPPIKQPKEKPLPKDATGDIAANIAPSNRAVKSTSNKANPNPNPIPSSNPQPVALALPPKRVPEEDKDGKIISMTVDSILDEVPIETSVEEEKRQRQLPAQVQKITEAKMEEEENEENKSIENNKVEEKVHQEQDKNIHEENDDETRIADFKAKIETNLGLLKSISIFN